MHNEIQVCEIIEISFPQLSCWKMFVTSSSLRENLMRIYWILLQFFNFSHNISQNTIRNHLKCKNPRISGQIVWVFLEWIVSMMFVHMIWPSFHLRRKRSSIRQTSGCFSGIVSVMHECAAHYHWRRDLQLLSTSIETWFLRTFCVTSQKKSRHKI